MRSRPVPLFVLRAWCVYMRHASAIILCRILTPLYATPINTTTVQYSMILFFSNNHSYYFCHHVLVFMPSLELLCTTFTTSIGVPLIDDLLLLPSIYISRVPDSIWQ